MNPNPLSSFSIISKTSDYFIMQHKETLKKSFYKEYFGSHLTEKEYNLVYDDFRRRKSLSNTSLISVYSYSIERQENIKNSPHYKFGLIYEFYIQNFQSELQPKLNTKLYWTQEELLNTLEATLQGLWELHKNGLTHGDIKSCNIVVNEEGFVKLADQFVTSSFYKKSIGQILEEKKAFLAPEILEICDNSFIETCENDLWAVGMVFLEAASLQEVNSVYDWEKKKIKKNVLEARIKIVKEIYDAKMSNIFEILLNKNSDERRKIYNLFDLGDIKQELKGKSIFFI